MRTLIDDILVSAVLLASIVYAFYALGPRTLRGRVLAAMAAILQHLPGIPGCRSLAERLQAAAAVKPAGACGGCDNCGSETPSDVSASGSEVRIPLSKIGRR